MNATVAAPEGERAWWLRTLLVLQAPRAVFAALRDESPDAIEARQDPVAALVFLGGIAGVLLAPSFGRLLDDRINDGLSVALIALIAGAIYGFFAYWVSGWVLAFAARGLGRATNARRCRHVFAFALAPLALSLLTIWPLRVAVYRGDVFRTGGADAGTGGDVLMWATVAFGVWSVILLFVGMGTVHARSGRARTRAASSLRGSRP
jgi:hypothetical protein